MPKKDSIPCPACGDPVPVRTGKLKGKPFIRCECGLIAHATKEKAIRAFMGDDPPAAIPAAAAAPKGSGKKPAEKKLDDEFFGRG